MTQDKAKQLLKKYLDGTAVPAEIKQVEDWYAQLNAGKSDVPDVRKLAIREQMLRKIQSAVHAKKIKKPFFRSHWLKIAAAVVLVISVTLSLRKHEEQHHSASALITASAKSGQRLRINLSDGSILTLEPFSKISYPSRFTGNSRQVELLEGEAFFSVAHDTTRPFHVGLPSDLQVKVLGTSFRIRSYKATNVLEVGVATGKVSVNNKGELLGVLTRNQHLQYDKLTGKSRIYINEKAPPVAIVFDGATLDEVIAKLEYVYNIRISLEDRSLSGLKCTATFSSAQRPEEILDIICSLHHIKVNSDKIRKTIKIYKE